MKRLRPMNVLTFWFIWWIKICVVYCIACARWPHIFRGRLLFCWKKYLWNKILRALTKIAEMFKTRLFNLWFYGRRARPVTYDTLMFKTREHITGSEKRCETQDLVKTCSKEAIKIYEMSHSCGYFDLTFSWSQKLKSCPAKGKISLK